MTVIPICVKTPKGIEEIEKRSCRLPMRVRQVLIMIDGKRDYETLAAMFPGDTLPAVCRQLYDEGFIAPLRQPSATASAPSNASARPGAAPSALDEQRLKMAGNLMTNALDTLVGSAAASLSRRVGAAPGLEHLLGMASAWREAVALTEEGRRELSDLESKLAVIDERFVAALSTHPGARGGGSAPSPADDEERLTMARNFMVNTLSAFVGIASSSLIERIEGSPGIDELRHLYGDWRAAIALTGDGRKRLGEFEEKLAALLS
ncbi:hypothetical protein [Accumulibacter sp.]|uniref:hypothetical protein n=1 Tax=Accumulibacter sp. TaxID=2053492 RepID=UPI00260AEE0B|nr:hypothetical protein [Accumulibacter sp.]